MITAQETKTHFDYFQILYWKAKHTNFCSKHNEI